jgi:hypothetical protein
MTLLLSGRQKRSACRLEALRTYLCPLQTFHGCDDKSMHYKTLFSRDNTKNCIVVFE